MKVIAVETKVINPDNGMMVVDEAGKSKDKFPTTTIIKNTKPSDVFAAAGKSYNHEVIAMAAVSSTQYMKYYYAPDCVKDGIIKGKSRRTKTVMLPLSLPVLGEDGKGQCKGRLFTTTNELWQFLLTAEGGYKELQPPKTAQPQTRKKKKTEWGI